MMKRHCIKVLKAKTGLQILDYNHFNYLEIGVRIPKIMLASYDLATEMGVDMSRQVLKRAEKSAGGFHANRRCVWPYEVALALH